MISLLFDTAADNRLNSGKNEYARIEDTESSKTGKPDNPKIEPDMEDMSSMRLFFHRHKYFGMCS